MLLELLIANHDTVDLETALGETEKVRAVSSWLLLLSICPPPLLSAAGAGPVSLGTVVGSPTQGSDKTTKQPKQIYESHYPDDMPVFEQHAARLRALLRARTPDVLRTVSVGLR